VEVMRRLLAADAYALEADIQITRHVEGESEL
jgi:hypothetical protein